MMLIVTIAVVLLLLLVSEWWWRTRNPHDEVSRKFIHITVGSFAAFWPYFLSWNEIIFLSIAFVVVVAISQYFGIFKAIHAVERPTWGEICFALAVGGLALFTREPVIYTVALLHMSLADGLAAIVGTYYGKSNSYKVFKHTKSIVGSLTFFAVSWVVLVGYVSIASAEVPATALILLAAVTTVMENFAVRGLDNLIVPVTVAVTLTVLG